MLDRRGGELFDTKAPPPALVTVPELSFLKKGPLVDDEPERREVAARFLEARTVKAGAAAWESLNKAERETYPRWKAIAAALAIGRNHALRAAGTDIPNGAHYTAALTDWLTKNFGNRPMPKATRYWCLRLHENLGAIEEWRATLPETKRAKLVNPLSVCRAWLRATAHPRSVDPHRTAVLAWRRFVSCVQALPADQASVIRAQAAAWCAIRTS